MTRSVLGAVVAAAFGNNPRWLWEALSPPPFETLNSFDNTRAVLGLALADVEREWFAFARARDGF